ncbi:PQQ-binding-like beta-propeller repeat protein, partial [Luteolibacter marinus]|uniref:outer membrane protein assembly factor BamB family protein n=1 Tax=Luteolibacter marinus TaxID=2776705 RepID=UPI001867811C
MKTFALLGFGFYLGSFGQLISAENWPAWRGPEVNGAAMHTPPPLDLQGKLLWKRELPGRGCSTPIIWESRIFVTCPIGDKDGILAFDKDGKELWRIEIGDLVPGRGQRVGSAANSSPITDGNIVVSYFKSGNLAVTDLAGKLLWQLNLPEKFGKDTLWWDQGTSPVFAGGNIVIAVMQTEGSSYLVAFDQKTGEVSWKTERNYPSAPESGDAYTTPHVVEVEGREQVISWGGRHLTAHDASSGNLLWECAGFIPEDAKHQRVIASAVVRAGLAVVPYNRGEGLAGIRRGAKGEAAWLWKTGKLGTDAVTPILRDNEVLVLKDSGPKRGRLTCLDADTGKQLWESQLPKSVHAYYASPVTIRDHFYTVREDGTIITGRLSSEGLTDLQSFPLEENVIASPASVDGRLFVRSDKHLFCFGT